jgi:hypothetical protein
MICYACIDDADVAAVVCSYIPPAIQVRSDSSLMRHELGYILGQMQNPGACDTLLAILAEESEDLLVRHEVTSLPSPC